MTVLTSYSEQEQMTVQSYKAGFDGGNTDTCFTSIDRYGHETIIVIPSVVAESSGETLEMLRSAMHSTNEPQGLYRTDIKLELNGTTYMVGYLPIRQLKLASTQKGDTTRYSSRDQLVRLLATSALAIQDTRYELDLVTTVPLGYYSKQLRRDVKDALEGIHTFTMNGTTRQATIRVRKVMIEGVPAMVLYGSASNGQPRIIIDGGGYTTEFIYLDGNDPIKDNCDGIELGVEDIGNYVAEQINEKYSRKLTLRERADILHAYGSRRANVRVESMPVISYGKADIPHDELLAIVRKGCEKIGEKTANKAASLWGVTNSVVAGDVRFQYHVGGSALFYNDVLRTRMPRLTAVSNAAEANARGSAQIAQALAG